MMNRKKNLSLPTEEEEKEENAVVRILQSPTCRRLFSWTVSDVAIPAEITAETREEQRLRWNFDFQTETPLPGRYQWVRTGEANGHRKNGSDEPERKRPCGGESSQKRQTSPSPCTRPEKRRAQPESTTTTTTLVSESTVSCDRALNEAEDAGRPLDLNDASSYGIDCT
ncbi:uncharacterized protein LOC129989154 [Argiope bruennichi]|uniref:Cyclin-dependent kinase inhibitor domain-containing protein n=1 Tax=Argiope bruennichi TaxID=94029 RepID=A0A8T0EB29_ARGBR|nr:uncharacterized protein LOC129989154 [Argiope bruennichi]KAF8770216.1 hypothetical protein HNY73_017773 [Argiope bruennichi]